MAGRGPAPAEKTQRRRANEPARGEWVDVHPFERGEKRVLPPLSALPKPPKRGGVQSRWTGRTRAAWNAWREDPATRLYGPADIQAAIDLVFMYEEWVRGAKVHDEIRQRQDRLGLNPKGKRDIRARLAEPGELIQMRGSTPAKKSSSDRRARLSVVK